MNAASKLAAMAKVLETPVKSKSGKISSLQSESCCAELQALLISLYLIVFDG